METAIWIVWLLFVIAGTFAVGMFVGALRTDAYWLETERRRGRSGGSPPTPPDPECLCPIIPAIGQTFAGRSVICPILDHSRQAYDVLRAATWRDEADLR